MCVTWHRKTPCSDPAGGGAVVLRRGTKRLGSNVSVCRGFHGRSNGTGKGHVCRCAGCGPVEQVVICNKTHKASSRSFSQAFVRIGSTDSRKQQDRGTCTLVVNFGWLNSSLRRKVNLFLLVLTAKCEKCPSMWHSNTKPTTLQ